MTEEVLTVDGDDRRIFLQSLREFSRDCPGPANQTRCPFVVAANGVHTCATQCEDLLDRFDRNGSTQGIDMGDGLTAMAMPVHQLPRKPLRRPFDSMEWYASENCLPLAEQSVTALLFALRDPFAPDKTALPGGAVMASKEIVDELQRRGVNVDGLMRADLALNLMIGTLTRVIYPLLRLRARRIDESQAAAEIDQDWAQYLFGDSLSNAERVVAYSDASDEEVEGLRNVISSHGPVVLSWFLSLAPADAFAIPVPPNGWNEPLDPRMSIDAVESRWLIDRSLKPYLHEWAQSSLFLEWDYISSKRDLPLSVHAGRTRVVNKANLAEVIADRAVAERDQKFDVHHALRDMPKTVAMNLLRDGARDAAIKVFESEARRREADGETHNNLGFCLLPDDFERALGLFEKAASLGMLLMDVNLANRVTALRALSRNATALVLAQEMWTTYGPRRMSTCWLWNMFSDQPFIEFVAPNLRVYEIAVVIAREVDPSQISLWEARLAETQELAAPVKRLHED